VARRASFSSAELEYLQAERRFGRLATVDTTGQPHVVPVGWWRYNAELGTIDIKGRDLAASKKFRNAGTNPKVAFVVDDMASIDPWRPRAVMIQGRAATLDPATGSDAEGSEAVIRISPENIVSWGLRSS
jgi:pyridoxamine 5'-phosphate oxidase family protein